MSLLNTMLEDIEQRSSQTPTGNDSLGVALSHTSADREQADPSMIKRSKIVFTILLIVGLMTGGMITWDWYPSSPTLERNAPTRVIAAVEPVNNVSDETVTETRGAHENTTQGQTVSEQEESAPVDDVKSETLPLERAELATPNVQELLLRAELAMEQNRLTRPESKNARYYYLLVQALTSPDSEAHAQASQGLALLALRYTQLVEQALARKDLVKAQNLLLRMSQLEIKSDQYTELSIALDRLKAESRLAKTLARANSEAAPSRQALTASPTSKPRAQEETLQVESTTALLPNSGASVVTGSLTVSSSLESQDKRLAAKAKAQLGKAGGRSVERDILQFLQTHSSALYSRLALFDYYLDAGLEADAQWLADNTPVKNTNSLRYFNARIRVAQGDYTSALHILKSELSPTELNTYPVAPVLEEKIQSLAAALSQQAGDHLTAFQLYRNLIGDYPSSSTYWLGYAVSAAHLGDAPRAKQGYTQVVALADLSPQVLQYANKQIVALGGPGNDSSLEVSQW